MANTYKLISSVTVTTATPTIEFTSIPSTYTDLIVKISTRSSAGDSSLELSFNNSTSNRSVIYLYGTGSGAASGSDTNMYITSAGEPSTFTASTFSNAELYIPNYASSNYKSSSVDAVSENNATLSYIAFTANLWSNTAAITSIKLQTNASNFVQYSTAYLYGISNA